MPLMPLEPPLPDETAPPVRVIRRLLIHPNPDVRRQALELARGALTDAELDAVLLDHLDGAAQWYALDGFVAASPHIQEALPRWQTDLLGAVREGLSTWGALTSGRPTEVGTIHHIDLQQIAETALRAVAARWSRRYDPSGALLLAPVRAALGVWWPGAKLVVYRPEDAP